MASILGISGLYHDSAACLLQDGKIVAAAQEERFTRKKHDPGLPVRAVAWCLQEGGVRGEELDYVIFYEKPLVKFDRLIETFLAFAPTGFSTFLHAMPGWLKEKLYLPGKIARLAGPGYSRPVVFAGHHEAHAASAFFPSPFARAAVLTIDGVGEWDTAGIWLGEGNRIRQLRRLEFPHSLGLLYSAFTYHTGFKVNSGEYKLMGLAPYGRPVYREKILQELIDLREDGSFAMDMRYFHYCEGMRMTNRRFEALFGGPARKPEAPITRREVDLAASIQAATEEIVLRMARTARALTGEKYLCLAGGVALNCVANGKLLREGIFEDIWIQPAAGDAGGALGAALLLHYALLKNPREPSAPDGMSGALLGPEYGREAIRAALAEADLAGEEGGEDLLLERTVAALAAGKVVGWFQGRMEFGPRALGGRSILGDPRRPEMQSRMNLKIKYRESFRPFAPSVLAEEVAAVFELDRPSPYMLLVGAVRNRRETDGGADVSEGAAGGEDPDLRRRVNAVRSDLPAITHVDYSARVQTVDARHGRYHTLLQRWKARTGCPVLINTSFNVRGEPIVCTPGDAIRCFLATDLDALAIGDFWVEKPEARRVTEADRQKHLNQFALD